jgi:hypothetical protein
MNKRLKQFIIWRLTENWHKTNYNRGKQRNIQNENFGIF